MVVQNKEELKKIIENAKSEGKSVLIKRGVFDIIHPGHIYTVQKLKEKADVLIILTVSDGLTRKKKGENRPINLQKQRSEVVDGLKGVDYVFEDTSLSREEYIALLKYLKPTLLAITLGDEKKSKAYTSLDWKLMEIKDKKRADFSTTDIIRKVLDCYIG